ncbi:putative nADH-quinone oxidoreductase subunit C [Mycobacterium xenopi 3993]|nr:putative nADH-quinone oxidoreductase subunit C [Mycobacterium xenopi 3993]
MIDVRRGMFGVYDTGDTSGYGRLVRAVTLPGSSPRPYGGYFDEVVDTLADALKCNGVEYADAIEKVVVYRDELTLHVRRELLPQVAQQLRDDPRLRFELCLGSVACITRTTPDANCTRSTRSSRSPTTVASGWKCLRRTVIRTSRRYSGSIRPTTGTNAKPTTFSESSSMDTRR